MTAAPTKILIVDDSALYRQSIQNVLREVPDASIVGVAKDGVEALRKIEELEPELLTLDVQMPDMDGIQVLREIKRRRLPVKAIMVSSLTSEGAKVTTDALIEGAFDFILKPVGSDSQENRKTLQESLSSKLATFRESVGHRKRRRLVRSPSVSDSGNVLEVSPAPKAACQAIILGASTGGPEALKAVLSKLPGNLAVPVLVVQHMPPKYTLSLAARMNEICPLNVSEAKDGAEVSVGNVLIAPGGTQMSMRRRRDSMLVEVTDDPPENGVRPSVDYLLRSAVNATDGNALAVIMTGMGRDGAEGCKLLKGAGGQVFAQHQDDCVVYGMPKAIVDLELADRILPLGKIAPAIVRHIKRSQRV